MKKNDCIRATKIASFYGFLSADKNIEDFEISKTDKQKAKNNSQLAEKIALIRMFSEKKMSTLPQPVMIYHNSLHNNSNLCLHIIGNPKSIADAIMIETCYIISKEINPDSDAHVVVNTIGDKESISKLNRELTIYYKKNWSKVPSELKSSYKNNLFESFCTKNETAIELRNSGPDPIRCLSENSRRHFKEVLDYIEYLKIPYIIKHSLIGNTSFGTETVFEIINNKNKKIIAQGQRFNNIARKYLGKKEVPSIGAEIFNISESSNSLKPNVKSRDQFKFYFIQLGNEAKMHSLELLEILRKAKIHVYQSLTKDKITTQLNQAEKMGIQYIIIMGKKEAMENSVLVRHMSSRKQETIHIKDLVEYAKKLP